jgi:flagellar hook-basal body complex protein FliE
MNMASPIAPLPPQVTELRFPEVRPARSSTGGPSFADRVAEFARDVNDSQKAAETAADDYAAGRKHDLHGTMITMSQADITLRLLVNVRNRVIEAYREIMRMGA